MTIVCKSGNALRFISIYFRHRANFVLASCKSISPSHYQQSLNYFYRSVSLSLSHFFPILLVFTKVCSCVKSPYSTSGTSSPALNAIMNNAWTLLRRIFWSIYTFTKFIAGTFRSFNIMPE